MDNYGKGDILRAETKSPEGNSDEHFKSEMLIRYNFLFTNIVIFFISVYSGFLYQEN